MKKGKTCKYFLGLIFMVIILNYFLSYAWAKNALVSIGTSMFQKASDLPACEDDAEHFADVLYEQDVIDEEVEPITGPNRKSIIEYKIKREAKALGKDDTLIIFNSSHGSKVNGIVAWDGYISDEELSKWISESECSRVILINDSCYSGKFKLDIPDKEILQINSSSAPMVSFVSSMDTMGYWNARNSVFTKYLVDAMRPGNSDKNGDGNVTAGEILAYVKYRMLHSEAEGMRNLEDTSFATLEDAKNAMDKALKDWQEAKKRGDTAAMDNIAPDYWKARYSYEEKSARVEMRWQSPTITGDPDFIVVREKSWKLCMEEKIKSKQFFCDLVVSVIPDPSTGQHVFEEPYCAKDPFKIKFGNINKFMKKYPELNKGFLPYKERGKRMENLYSKRRNEEFRLIEEKGIEDKANFAESCGNCKLERKEGASQGGEFDYNIVCWDERSGMYKTTVDAYNCGSRWERTRFKLVNPEVERVIKENRYIGGMLSLFKTLKACGYNKSYWKE